ncbi:MAG: acylphosphatase [Deltaproteobacteria bacterium]|nr:acylphosphatase [Deltaproteobacteria bacterium]
MSAISKLQVCIRGRVQGVGFRNFTRRTALQQGILGWVRNCEDGSVEAVLHGSKEAVDQLLVKLKQGPPLSQVEAIEIYEDLSEDCFEDFTIR